MAMPTASPVAAPSAHVVGSAFVEQYYHILHASPELVYRFYQDTSVLTRPDASGAMKSVTTMQAINDMILSLDYKNYNAEIKSADAQESYKDGVMVLVTGCLTGKDHKQRKFAQSFFLAPQDKGYFVFNDVFRYLDESESPQINPGGDNGTAESAESVNITKDPEPIPVPEQPVEEPATLHIEESLDNGEEVPKPLETEEETVVDVEVVAESVDHPSQIEVRSISETASSDAQEHAPKKSYASIVKVMKGERRPVSVYVPTKTARVMPAKTEQQAVGPAAPASGPEASAPSSNDVTAASDVHEEGDGHSIYIRNLPMNAEDTEVEEEFKKFGPIKPGGVQVRSNKQQGYCFGFVEFESFSSMQSAIEASPVTIGGRQSFVEQKRTTSRGAGRRERFPPNKGGERNDNFRGGRGGNYGGRGFGRNDFGNRGEYSGRGRGGSSSGRGGENYQRVNPGGGGRGGGRQGGGSKTNNP